MSAIIPGAHRIRIHLSSSHLYSAHFFAQCATQLEQEVRPKSDPPWLQHRSYVMNSIMSSVAFLEAAVNELYVICSEHPDDIHVKGHPQDTRFKNIGRDSIQLIAGLWSVENFRRGANVLDKCQAALGTKHAKFDKGSNPYQDAKLTVDLRNLLVHFQPEEREITVGAQTPYSAFEARYRGKFPENPFSAKYAIISTGPEPEELDYPFFPEKCLGSGCAVWAAKSILTFTDEMFCRLGTTWYHHWLFDKGLIPTF